MTCAACVARVERALTAAPGVELATVNLATRQAKVKFNHAPHQPRSPHSSGY